MKTKQTLTDNPLRQRWRVFRATILLITLLLLSALSLMGWRIYQQRYPDLPAVADPKVVHAGKSSGSGRYSSRPYKSGVVHHRAIPVRGVGYAN